MTTLVSDAAAPIRREIDVQTITLTDDVKLEYELAVRAPAVLRDVYARAVGMKGRVVGSPKREAIVIALVYEVDPEGSPITRCYYVLPFGRTAEGAAVAEMVFAGIATLSNGAPIAIYELPPRPPAPVMPLGAGAGALLNRARLTENSDGDK